MAQWNGQFTGNSHSTKVDDYEYMLEHAISVFKTCDIEVKAAKAKSVKKLAAKVLNVRLKQIRAKCYEVEPVASKELKDKRVQVDHLQEREANLRSEGVDGILREFGVPELTEVDD